jgi:methyltransferase-like protein
VHADASFTRSISPLPIANFHIFSSLKRTDPQPDDLPEDGVHFLAPDGNGFVTGDKLMIHALDIIAENRGNPLPFRDLLRRARERLYAYSIPATTLEEDAGKLAPALLQFYSRSPNMVDFLVSPAAYITTLSERPVASKYARYQAISSDMVTNQRQNRVQLGPNARALIGMLDGSNDRPALIDGLRRLTLKPEGVSDSEHAAKMADEVDRLMDQFRTSALLVG